MFFKKIIVADLNLIGKLKQYRLFFTGNLPQEIFQKKLEI